MLRPYTLLTAPSLDTQRANLSRGGILRPQHDSHRMGVVIDLPARDARPDKFLTVVRRETLRRGVEELHQLHAHLEVSAAVAARGDADTDIVIELAAHEPLGHFEQPAHDHALQHHAVLAAQPPRQNTSPGLVETEGKELPPDLRMRPSLALGLAVPLGLRAGGEVVPVELEKLGHG